MTTEAEVEGAGGITILIADDDPEILGMLSLRLGKRGYRVLTSSDGAAALEDTVNGQPALVILDVMMPRMTGWEVARALRQTESTKDVKIVMLTAIGDKINEMTSPLYGVDAYFDKPFEFAEIEATIARLLDQPE